MCNTKNFIFQFILSTSYRDPKLCFHNVDHRLRIDMRWHINCGESIGRTLCKELKPQSFHTCTCCSGKNFMSTPNMFDGFFLKQTERFFQLNVKTDRRRKGMISLIMSFTIALEIKIVFWARRCLNTLPRFLREADKCKSWRKHECFL